jgi:hypothetical protein
MDTWEYLTVYIRLETKRTGKLKKTFEWAVELPDGERITGMADILDHYGHLGWELVNVIDEYRGGNTVSSQAEVYRAFFKRKLLAVGS